MYIVANHISFHISHITLPDDLTTSDTYSLSCENALSVTVRKNAKHEREKGAPVKI